MIAVVVTLIYLVRETRKNSEAIDATSSREAFHQISDWHLEVARDPELKRIVLKSTSGFAEIGLIEGPLLVKAVIQIGTLEHSLLSGR